jgi:Putative transposase of IS4/5 family (DUF4096)
MSLAPWVVSDGRWERIEPLLPKVERRFRFPGRKRVPDRQALHGILYVLYTGCAWRFLRPTGRLECRPRDLSAENLELVTKHQQLDVSHLQTATAPNKGTEHSPDSEIRGRTTPCPRSSQASPIRGATRVLAPLRG